jgi:hypothetical protein
MSYKIFIVLIFTIHLHVYTLFRENEELTKDILKIFIRLSSANQAVDYLIDKNVISRIILCITATTNGIIINFLCG